MRPARAARLTLLALACIALLLVAAAWALARTGWAAEQVAGRASAALGQPVRLARLSVGLLPHPSVGFEELEVGPDGPTGPLLSVARGAIDLGWGDLAEAPRVLERLRLDGLALRPRIDAAGRDNWSALVDRLVELAGDGPSAFDLGEVVLEGGQLEFADAVQRSGFGISGLALEARDLRPATPFPLRLRLAGQAGEQVFHVALEAEATLDPDRATHALEAGSLRGWIGGGPFGHGGADLAGVFRRIGLDLGTGTFGIEDLDFDAFGLQGRARVSGALAGGAPAATFWVSTRAFQPRAVANALGQPLPATNDPEALGEALLELEGRWDAAGLSLERIEGRVDGTTLTGSLDWPVPPAVPRLAMSLDAVELDRYLPPDAGEPDSPAEALAAAFGALDALRLDAVVEVGQASLAGATARGLRVVVEPPAGEGTGR